MSAPDPEGMTLLSKVIAAAAAVLAPVWGFMKLWDKKADKDDIKNALKHIEKLYENAEKDRALTRDLHDKAMDRIAANQSQLIGILGREREVGR